MLKATKDEVVKASFPKRFRDVASLEEQAGPQLAFGAQQWARFVAGVRVTPPSAAA